MLAGLTSWALSHDVEVLGLTVERLTLEDVYLNLTGYRSDAATSEPDAPGVSGLSGAETRS